MRAFFIKSHGGTSQSCWFHGLMLELRHSVITEMNDAISTFYHKWLDIGTKQELFRYQITNLIGRLRNTWDMDLAKLFHLTDSECDV